MCKHKNRFQLCALVFNICRKTYKNESFKIQGTKHTHTTDTVGINYLHTVKMLRIQLNYLYSFACIAGMSILL
jgi:hypothetical protein